MKTMNKCTIPDCKCIMAINKKLTTKFHDTGKFFICEFCERRISVSSFRSKNEIRQHTIKYGDDHNSFVHFIDPKEQRPMVSRLK